MNRTMIRKKRIEELDRDEPGLDISSFIDVCFLLLIYFLVTTQIVRKEQEISSTIPDAEPTPTEQPEMPPLSLVITEQREVMLIEEGGGLKLLDEGLEGRELPVLDRVVKQHCGFSRVVGEDPRVKIRVAGEVEQQRVIDILNVMAKYGVSHITYDDL